VPGLRPAESLLASRFGKIWRQICLKSIEGTCDLIRRFVRRKPLRSLHPLEEVLHYDTYFLLAFAPLVDLLPDYPYSLLLAQGSVENVEDLMQIDLAAFEISKDIVEKSLSLLVIAVAISRLQRTHDLNTLGPDGLDELVGFLDATLVPVDARACKGTDRDEKRLELRLRNLPEVSAERKRQEVESLPQYRVHVMLL